MHLLCFKKSIHLCETCELEKRTDIIQCGAEKIRQLARAAKASDRSQLRHERGSSLNRSYLFKGFNSLPHVLLS